MPHPGNSPLRKLLVYFGLAWPEAGAPRGKAKRSRYGGGASARLDEDIDELRAELEALKRDRR